MTIPDTVAGHVVVTARCCRDWPVSAWAPLGRCGLCGERPVIVPVRPR